MYLKDVYTGYEDELGAENALDIFEVEALWNFLKDRYGPLYYSSEYSSLGEEYPFDEETVLEVLMEYPDEVDGLVRKILKGKVREIEKRAGESQIQSAPTASPWASRGGNAGVKGAAVGEGNGKIREMNKPKGEGEIYGREENTGEQRNETRDVARSKEVNRRTQKVLQGKQHTVSTKQHFSKSGIKENIESFKGKGTFPEHAKHLEKDIKHSLDKESEELRQFIKKTGIGIFYDENYDGFAHYNDIKKDIFFGKQAKRIFPRNIRHEALHGADKYVDERYKQKAIEETLKYGKEIIEMGLSNKDPSYRKKFKAYIDDIVSKGKGSIWNRITGKPNYAFYDKFEEDMNNDDLFTELELDNHAIISIYKHLITKHNFKVPIPPHFQEKLGTEFNIDDEVFAYHYSRIEKTDYEEAREVFKNALENMKKLGVDNGGGSGGMVEMNAGVNLTPVVEDAKSVVDFFRKHRAMLDDMPEDHSLITRNTYAIINALDDFAQKVPAINRIVRKWDPEAAGLGEWIHRNIGHGTAPKKAREKIQKTPRSEGVLLCNYY